jgi:hypothetical protein
MAHQYLHQLEPDIRHAVLGNAGTLISFRLGAEDAGTSRGSLIVASRLAISSTLKTGISA